MKFIDIILMFFIYSFIGWLIEVLEGVINRREFVNRGFLIGPYCPIYGFGGIMMTFFLKKYSNDYVVIFVLGSLICTILEYFTSLVLEKIFNTRWWDYRDKKIHLNGRVCLEVMILFGISALFLIKIINPFLEKTLTINANIKIIIVSVLLVLFLIDNLVSIKVLVDMKKEKLIKDEDITKKMNKRIREVLLEGNYFTKRVLNAFPLLKSKTRH